MARSKLVQIDYDKVSATTSDRILFLIMEGMLVWVEKKSIFAHDEINNHFKISEALAIRNDLI